VFEEPGQLKQAVRRNNGRFPPVFMFHAGELQYLTRPASFYPSPSRETVG